MADDLHSLAGQKRAFTQMLDDVEASRALERRAKEASQEKPRKVIHKSPWGDFVNLYISGHKYARSAQGGFWTIERGTPWRPKWYLNLLARYLPIYETIPDTFSPMLQHTVPGAHTDMWRRPGE